MSKSKQVDAVENRIIKDILKEEKRLAEMHKNMKKIEKGKTKLDKPKRLETFLKEIIKTQGKINVLEKQLSVYRAKQRLVFVKLLQEKDKNRYLDYDTASKIAALIGKKRKSKKKSRSKSKSKSKSKN